MVVRKFMRAFGYDIKRYPPRESIDYGRNRLICQHGINLVFDVGANIGSMRSHFVGLVTKGK